VLTDVLMLCSRLPYPAHRADTTSSFHLLQFLAQRHRVHLGTFIDDPDDARHIDAVGRLCKDLWVGKLGKTTSVLRMAAGVIRGEPAGTARYRDPELKRWLKRTIRATKCKHLIVHSSCAARSIPSKFLLDRNNRLIVDFDNFQPELWLHKASLFSFPLNAFYRHEARKQIEFDRRLALRAKGSIVRSAEQSASFLRACPEIAPRLSILSRGVDRIYFSADPNRPSPYSEDELAIVFTGLFNSLPYIDAAKWIAHDILPLIKKRVPAARLYLVGESPSIEVRALASADLSIVDDAVDVRSYVQHSKIVVAPSRIGGVTCHDALIAMSMGKPLIASPSLVSELASAVEGEEYLVAESAEKMADLAVRLLVQPDIGEAVGANARVRIERDFDWDRSLAQVENLLLGRTL
jgi:polysaccharide biosynthesis protein PslH